MKTKLILLLALLAVSAPAQLFNYPAPGPTVTQFLALSNSVAAINPNGSLTNLSLRSGGTTNRALRVFSTNSATEMFVNKDGTLALSGDTAVTKLWIYGHDSALGTTEYLRMGYDSSGAYDYVLRRAAGTGQLQFYGTQSGGSAYHFEFNGESLVDYKRLALSTATSLIRLAAGTGGSAEDNISLELTPAGSGVVYVGTSNLLADAYGRSVFATNLYATNLFLGGGGAVTAFLPATATLNFDLTLVTTEDLTLTVTGAVDGDDVVVGAPAAAVTATVRYSAWVSAANTVTIRASTSAVGEDPASGVFSVTVIQH